MSDSDSGKGVCDLCMMSEVTVDRTTFCGKTIGIECGCEGDVCADLDCEECNAECPDRGEL